MEIKDTDLAIEKIRFELEQEKVFLHKGIAIIDLEKNTGIPSKV